MPEASRMSDRLMDVYDRLYVAYGPQHWWPGDGPFEAVSYTHLTLPTICSV